MSLFLQIAGIGGTLALLGFYGWMLHDELRPWSLPKIGAAVLFILGALAMGAHNMGWH